jgi:hypothetical protein
VAEPDGGVPFVLPSARGYSLAPWMVPDGGSHLTFGLAALLGTANVESDWLSAATAWCWDRLQQPEGLSAYWLKYALEFLNRADDAQRAFATIETLRPLLNPDGSIPVSGGTAGRRVARPRDTQGAANAPSPRPAPLNYCALAALRTRARATWR